LKERLVSLDAFRGITIAGMILVNNPGNWGHVYSPLLHAKWHGWTPTDLIFPFFLFIVGVAMTFSLSKQMETKSKKDIYLKIFRRTLIIFGLGLFLTLFPFFHFSTIRIPGVLQRIAVCYCIASIIFINTDLKKQVIFTGGILVLYWALMKLVPVPGYGAGDLSVEGNLAAYIDFNILEGHMWKKTWDPEGILSTIPAISTTLSGVLTGHLLRSGMDKRDITGWLFVIGWIAIVAGLLWGIIFPLNKSLWTSSYVVFTSGAALQFLGFCYWLIDVKGIVKWAKFAIIYGMNAIAVFVLSGLVARLLNIIKVGDGAGDQIALKTWIYENIFSSWLNPTNASLAFAVTTILFWLAMMTILYRKKIFIKI
jgi:predicted acyltransferase